MLRCFTENKRKLWSADSGRWKASGSPESLGFVLCAPWMSLQSVGPANWQTGSVIHSWQIYHYRLTQSLVIICQISFKFNWHTVQEKKKQLIILQSFKPDSYTLCQTVWFCDGKAIYRALVSTWVQGDAACFVFNVAVLCCDAGALQRDICPITAQRCPPCNQRKYFLNVTYGRSLWTREYFCEVFLGYGLKPEVRATWAESACD